MKALGIVNLVKFDYIAVSSTSRLCYFYVINVSVLFCYTHSHKFIVTIPVKGPSAKDLFICGTAVILTGYSS